MPLWPSQERIRIRVVVVSCRLWRSSSLEGMSRASCRADGRIGFVIGVKADKDVVRTSGVDEFVMRAADAAGGDRADVGTETNKSFSLSVLSVMTTSELGGRELGLKV